MINLKCPCKNCKDRHSACHDTCDKYIDFKNKNAEIRNRILEEKSIRCALKNTTEHRLKTKIRHNRT